MSQFRGTRIAAISAAVLILSIAGHSFVGHALLMSPAAMLIGAVISVALAVAATAQRHSIAWLFGFLLGAEALMHAVFVMSGSHAGHSVLPSPSMILGHVLATVVAVALLRIGDGELTRWAHFLSHVFTRDVAITVDILHVRIARPIVSAVPVFNAHLVMSSLRHRGPPLFA